MGVIPSNLKDPTFVTPCCNCCGICLCWDLSIEEYEARKAYWDAWECEECRVNHDFTYHDRKVSALRIGYETALIKLDEELGTLLVRRDELKIEKGAKDE